MLYTGNNANFGYTLYDQFFLDILCAVHAEWWQSELLPHFHNASCDMEYQMAFIYTNVQHHKAWWAYMMLDAKWLNTQPVL